MKIVIPTMGRSDVIGKKALRLFPDATLCRRIPCRRSPHPSTSAASSAAAAAASTSASSIRGRRGAAESYGAGSVGTAAGG